eukprot:c20731_g2_i1.p1 GENE.c20731_g2_i1~~c20731_g2_i1.p1  ORF type:complete len:123 (+),score=26.33 c20731_g2_i1:114-482(+)
MMRCAQRGEKGDGMYLTIGPSTYKIPSFNDIPVDFRVSLLKNAPNKSDSIYSSKGVGEPPLFLGAAVMLAARKAVESARSEEGLGNFFVLDSPATVERLRIACADQFTSQFAGPDERPKGNW